MFGFSSRGALPLIAASIIIDLTMVCPRLERFTSRNSKVRKSPATVAQLPHRSGSAVRKAQLATPPALQEWSRPVGLALERRGRPTSAGTALLEPVTALGCQLTVGGCVVQPEFISIEQIAPATVGPFVEEGIATAAEYHLRLRHQFLAMLLHFREGAIVHDGRPRLCRRTDFEEASDTPDFTLQIDPQIREVHQQNVGQVTVVPPRPRVVQDGTARIAVVLPGVAGAGHPVAPELMDVLGTGPQFVADPPG